jgi:serpin B
VGTVPDPDAAEFDDFYQRSRERVLAAVAAASPAAVEDVAEAYQRAWGRWTYVGGLPEPEAWVREVAGRLAASRWRGVRRLGRRSPAGADWRPADTVRRAVVLRRRRRAIGAAFVVAAVIASALAATRGTPAARSSASTAAVQVGHRLRGAVQLVADVAPTTAADSSAVRAVSRAEQALTFALLRKLAGPGNLAVSPESLNVALGMLRNAARGATGRQLAAAMQASGLSTSVLNAGLAGLTGELRNAARDDGITLQSANSLWQQRGFPVRRPFLDALATYYGAGVWQADFAGHVREALAAIDAWTSRQTQGKITKLFDALDPSTVLVLANAIYYHAAWARPFDRRETTPGTFVCAEGRRVSVPFMAGAAGLRAGVGPGYQAVSLPYRGGRFSALAVMPTSQSLTSFVESLTPGRITSITSALQVGLAVRLPRFTTTSTLDLVPTLRALGMRDAFDGRADFSGLSPAATQVDQVVQRVYLGVGEKGTTAAAVTGISAVMAARPLPTVVLDHPFLFLVRDDRSGTILFAAQIRDPSAR